MSTVEPGWYPDPAEPSTQRYWDGEGWTGDPLPADVPSPASAPPSAGASTVTDVPERPVSPVPPTVTQDPVTPAPATFTQSRPVLHLPPGVQPPPGYRLVQPAQPQRETPHGYPLADPMLRLAARVVDVGVVLLLNVAVNGWFVYRWWGEFWPFYSEFIRRSSAGQPTNDLTPPDVEGLLLAIMAIAVGLWFAYEVPGLAGRGQTLGKRLVGIRVMAVDNQAPIGFRRAIRRWNTLAIPTFLWCCGLGFVLQFVDCLFVLIDTKRHQALHDRGASTVVVHVGRRAEAKAGTTQQAGPAQQEGTTQQENEGHAE